MDKHNHPKKRDYLHYAYGKAVWASKNSQRKHQESIKFQKKVTGPVVTVKIAQSNTIPDKSEQQTLINEAKLEKAQKLQEHSKQIEALIISTRQVIKQTKMVGESH